VNYAVTWSKGRITCFLYEEFSHNHKKVLGDWYDLAVGGLDVRFLQGNIFTMWQEPYIQILAEKLRACLNEAPNAATLGLFEQQPTRYLFT
jgi:hypothetical protein